MGKIRIGVLGFGFIGTIHAKAAENCGDTELMGVWTQPDQTLDNLKRMFPTKKHYESPEAMAADPEVDAVVIGLPNSLHLPMGKLMFENGKHVLMEKPMAMNVQEAKELIEAAKKADRRLMVGHMWRFDREAVALRALLDEGEFGEVIKTKSYGIHQNWGPAGWFTHSELAGGGALIDMGVHALDTTRYLLGDPNPKTVYAVVDRRFGDYDVDDNGVTVITWDNGVTSIIESGWWHPHADGPEASTQIFAKKGYARLFPTMAKYNDEREPWLPRFPTREDHCDQHIYNNQMQEFASAIAEGRDPVPGPEEGLVIMRLCEAAYESAKTGDVVKLS